MCCDTERAEYEKQEAKRRERHANRTLDEIRENIATLQSVLDGKPCNLGASILLQMGGRDLDREAITAEIARDQALLDAAYAEEFPDGPQPDFVARLDNPDDLALLKTFAHAAVLRSLYANGRTPAADAELTRRVTEARLIQAARQALCPNEQDRKAKAREDGF